MNERLHEGHQAPRRIDHDLVRQPAAIQAKVVWIVDAEHDVCVLRGSISGDVIQLANWDPVIGERVWTAGYPRGTFLISDGFWAGRNEEGQGVSSSVAGFGASGSPIMDVSGRTVGVLVARYKDMDNLTFITPVEWVRAALIRAHE